MARGFVGGPGWIIDEVTLVPRITDVAELRKALAPDPLGDAIEALWSGRPHAAASLLRRHEPTLRVRALLADCRRDGGDPSRAVDDYRGLVDECLGTSWEAVMRQHLGKALFAAQRVEEAAEQFARALSLREDAGAEESLLASSRLALEVTTRTGARSDPGSRREPTAPGESVDGTHLEGSPHE